MEVILLFENTGMESRLNMYVKYTESSFIN